MAFCANCGANLIDGSRFCANCGVATQVSQHIQEEQPKTQQSKRKSEYVGSVKKCPSCGEEIISFTAICPACGHELNSTKISSALEKFITQIDMCERLVASSPSANVGWSSWSKAKKIWWVIFNIFFTCIPLVIYLVYPLITIKSTPKLSKEEKQLASLIENFSFPNDRESILGALVYAKEKINFISQEKIDRKSAYWMRLWCSKAEQLKQKADMLFPNDNIARQSYEEILIDEKCVNDKIKYKAIVGGVLFIIVFFCVLTRNGAIDTTDFSEEFDWQTNGLFAYLPQPNTNNGKIMSETAKQIQIELYNITPEDFEAYVKACREAGFTVDVTKNDSVFYADNEQGHDLTLFYYENNKVLKISLDCYNSNESNIDIQKSQLEEVGVLEIAFDEGTYEDLTLENYIFSIPNYWDEDGSKEEYYQTYAEMGGKVVMLSIAYPIDEEDEVTLQALLDDNDNMIKTIEATFGDCKVTENERFCSDFGVEGMLYTFTFREGTLFNKYDGKGKNFCFPSEKDNRWFFIVLMQTENADKDYIDDYMKILASIREVEDEK